MAKTTIRFVFISEPERPIVTLSVPEDMVFDEALALAANSRNKDPTTLSTTYPAGTPITGSNVGEVVKKNPMIHVIDAAIVGSA
jgi:hypothetical protein